MRRAEKQRRNDRSRPYIGSVFFLFLTILFISFYGSGFLTENSRAVDTQTISCNAGGSRTLSVGAYVDADGSTFSTGTIDLVLNAGTGGPCTFTFTMTQSSSSIALNSLIVGTNVTLTHATSTGSADTYTQLFFTLAAGLTVESGGIISADGKGYLGGNQTGNASDFGRTNGNTVTGGSNRFTGGSHGGRGGYNGGFAIADSYDTIVAPTLPGSGGGGNTTGGNGGGVIRMTAASTTIDGTITADGGVAGRGGGAGGTIFLTISGAVQGSGTIGADGGDGNSGGYAGGGGGRIAIAGYTSLSIATSSFTAKAGNSVSVNGDGSAGTVFLQRTGTNGAVYVNNGAITSSYHPTDIDNASDATFDRVVVDSNARLWIESTASDLNISTLEIFPTGVVESDRAETMSGISSSALYLRGGTAQFDNSLTVTNFLTDGTVTGTLVTYATTTISSGSVTVGNGLTWSAGGAIQKSSTSSLDAMTIKSGGILTHPASWTNATYTLAFSVNELLVDSGGFITSTGKGYLGGFSSTVYYASGILTTSQNGEQYGRTNGNTTSTGSYQFSGGSHAGRGGLSGTSQVGLSYDALTNPTLPGGGSGGNDTSNYGDSGGGVIRITAVSTTVNGTISANGGASGKRGGGGGGSIYLSVSGAINGSGTISANGGAPQTSYGGGGGGRVAIVGYTSLAVASSSITAYGAVGSAANLGGAAGTVYLRLGSQTYGDLIINNTGVSNAYYTTSLVTTSIPAADQVAAFNNGYVFNVVSTSNYGLLNIDSALDASPGGVDSNRKFFAASCAANNDSATNGELVYNLLLAGGDVAANGYDSCTLANTAPTVTGLSLSPYRDGSGYASLRFTVDDDNNDALRIKIEYVSSTCTYSGQATTTLASAVSSTYGQSDIIVTSTGAYQLQSVTTTPGANTVTTTWQSRSNVPTANGLFCVFVTANDGTATSTIASTTLTLDNVAPTAPGALTISTTSTQSVMFRFGATSTETNFSYYTIYYKAGSSGVTQNDTAFTSTSDANLASSSFALAATTTLPSLATNTQYAANIWAYDTYGNSASSSGETAFYTLAAAPTSTSAAGGSNTAIIVSWGTNTNPSSTEYYAYDIANSARNSGWVTTTQLTFSLLSSCTPYTFAVKARNGNTVETTSATTSPAQTLASCDTSGSSVSPVPTQTPLPSDLSQKNEKIEDILQPSGVLRVFKNGSPVLYTNTRSLTIGVNTLRADIMAFHESDKEPEYSFKDSPQQPVAAFFPWTIKGDDGVKCMNVRLFESVTGAITDTYTCVVFDTTPPKPPIITELRIDVSPVRAILGRLPERALLIQGTSEPSATITLTTEKKEKLGFFLRAVVRVVARFFPIVNRSEAYATYATRATDTGVWQYIFPEQFDLGTYTITASAEDQAGNSSSEVTQSITVASPSDSSQETASSTSEHPPDEPLKKDDDEVRADKEKNKDTTDEKPIDIEETEDTKENKQDASEKELIQDEEARNDASISDAENDMSRGPDVIFDGSAQNKRILSESMSSAERGIALLSTLFSSAIDTLSATMARIGNTAGVLGTSLAQSAQAARHDIGTVVNNPKIESVTDHAVLPTVGAIGVINVAAGFQFPQMLLFLRSLFTQPLLLFTKKKRQRSGIVYNAFTGAPIDLAIVRMVDAAAGRIIQSRVTDAMGRYVFFAPAGSYRLEVRKEQYSGIQTVNAHMTEDVFHTNTYRGAVFGAAAGQVIDFAIPLDPSGEETPTREIRRAARRLALRKGISAGGIIVAGMGVVITPTVFMSSVFCLHLVLYLLFSRLSQRSAGGKRVGTVWRQANHAPVARAVVRLFDQAYQKLVDTAVTDRTGTYGFLAQPRMYTLTVDMPQYEKTEKTVSCDKDGLIAVDIVLVEKQT